MPRRRDPRGFAAQDGPGVRSSPMRFTHLVGLALLVVASTPFACGGTAVVERGGEGGTANTTSTTGTTGTTSTASNPPDTSVTSTSTGNDPHAQNCATLCAALDDAGCGDGSCVTGCTGAEVQLCGAEYVAYVACLVQNPVSDPCTTISDLCLEAQYQLDACSNPGCPPTECGGASNGSCFCDGVCFDAPYSIQCTANGDMTFTCACILNGTTVGSCQETLGCPNTMYPGCCASFLGFPD
jgi:hypothetical protein